MSYLFQCSIDFTKRVLKHVGFEQTIIGTVILETTSQYNASTMEIVLLDRKLQRGKEKIHVFIVL